MRATRMGTLAGRAHQIWAAGCQFDEWPPSKGEPRLATTAPAKPLRALCGVVRQIDCARVRPSGGCAVGGRRVRTPPLTSPPL